MSIKTIHSLKITNYKSIDSLELKGLSLFAVFAGPNGSGKSNFFDALDFVSRFIRHGIDTALSAHGGFANIRSEKRNAEESNTFTFDIACELVPDRTDTDAPERQIYAYSLVIHELDKTPIINECLYINGKSVLTRNDRALVGLNTFPPLFPKNYSALLFFFDTPLATLLRNINLYRIDPIGAKEPNQSDNNPSKLDKKGHNLASVLNRLESDEIKRETIMEWMEMMVPGLENVLTESQQLESKTAILFKEQGTQRRFSAHLVSDGTVYALSLLVAVLDKPDKYSDGLTLIEEPERGLHPTAIRELISLVREQATANQPIWMTTHSESVVRELALDELVLVNKVEGRTHMKIADSGKLSQADLAPLGLDEAWLSNLLDGGTL